MNPHNALRASTWTRYWASGAIHSCAGSYDNSYSGPIHDYWTAGFTALPPNARVLDIACGNGPLPRLMLDIQSRPDLSCEAIDLAELAPTWLNARPTAQRERVHFHTACAAEQLPFADHSFDWVVSQWGLEYSDLTRSVPELLRVLAPTGAIQLLLHHEQALPVRLGRLEIEHINWLERDQGFLQYADAMVVLMGRAATAEGRQQLAQDASANAVREQFNAQLSALEDRIEQGACVDVLLDARQRVNQYFGLAMQQGSAAAQRALHDFSSALRDAMLRLRDLCEYALNETAAVALAEQLSRGAGKSHYTLAPLSDRGNIMGWGLQVRPAAD